MATLNKNFKIKNGLVVEGSTATVNGQNILTETGSDQYILDLVGGANLIDSVNSTQLEIVNGELSVKSNVFDAYGSASTAESNANTYTDNAVNGLDTDDIEEGATNQYFTNQRALDATASAYDAAGTADTAISNALGPAGTIATAIATAQDNAEDYADSLASNYDAAGAASTAEGNANTYTDNQINALTTADIEEFSPGGPVYFTDQRAKDAVGLALASGGGLSYDTLGSTFSVDTSMIATQSYVDTAVNNLIDGAPGLLDTLNEIAAAINDDENYFTTVTNAIAAKQDTLTAGANIDISSIAGALTISVTGLDTDDVAEGSNLYFTDARARDAVDGTDRSFTSVEVNSVAKQIAATTGNIVTAEETTAYSWEKSEYRSGKFTVKVKNGSHTEVSEILVTLDTSDNVSITEYGIVGTNGSLAIVTADVWGPTNNLVRIRVTPANNNSEVMIAGTLLI